MDILLAVAGITVGTICIALDWRRGGRPTLPKSRRSRLSPAHRPIERKKQKSLAPVTDTDTLERAKIQWMGRSDQAAQLLKRWRRDQPEPAHLFGRLRRMDPYTFEDLVLLCFEERGYAVKRTPGYSRDSGVDGWVKIGDRWHACQMKRWRKHISKQDVIALGKLAKEQNVGALFVHTGRTGRGARAMAGMRGIGIISGESLLALVMGRQTSISAPAS